MSALLAVEYKTDSLGSLMGYAAGIQVSAMWGPAVEGDWFVAIAGQPTRRVATREEAVRALPATWPAIALPTTTEGGVR